MSHYLPGIFDIEQHDDDLYLVTYSYMSSNLVRCTTTREFNTLKTAVYYLTSLDRDAHPHFR